MRRLRGGLVLTAASFVIAAGLAQPASAQELKAEVLHWWTSGGESAALNVFAEQFKAAGGEWVDTGIATGEAARAAGINRIVGGNPPTVMQFNTGAQFTEVVENGMLRDLQEVAEAGKWNEVLPPVIVEATTRDGKFYAVPVNIHGENWIFYNKKIFDDNGLTPPTTIKEIIDLGPKLKDAGVIPLALGGQPWQERFTWFSVFLAEGGKDLYLKVQRDKDASAVRSEEFKTVAETFGQMRDLVDEGSPGRNWNDATNLVITGQAAMQIMGDWAKGEFIAAGQTAGVDYGCNVLGTDGYMMGGDVFVFPLIEDEAQQAAQVKMAEIMFDGETQLEFNKLKGSVPVRLDLDVSEMDVCAQKGMELLQDPEKQIGSINFLATPDFNGPLQDLVTEFWNSPEMAVDDFVENYATAVEANS